MTFIRQTAEKRWNGVAVDIIAAALALRFEDVVAACVRVEREGFGGRAGGGGVERVDGSKGGADRGGGCRVGDEAGEMRGGGCGEDLLDFFGTGEVGEDGGAFDGGGSLEMGSRAPGGGGGEVVGWGVAGAEVEG